MSKRKIENNKQAPLRAIHPHAAGIDVGAESHYVAVPAGSVPAGQNVRKFEAFTCDLHALSHWLKSCGVTTVAMESTGVYWIALFELLEADGFEVLLVDARHVKNVPGRKSDVRDCQWLQELHSYGLLSGAFRPAEQGCVLRSYLRQRGMLVQQASQHIQHMQKALTQMNLKLQHVVGDISGSDRDENHSRHFERGARAAKIGGDEGSALQAHRRGDCQGAGRELPCGTSFCTPSGGEFIRHLSAPDFGVRRATGGPFENVPIAS